MARTSYQTYLMHYKDGNTAEKLIDIKDTPDTGKDPDTIDITTLSDNQKRYLADILDPGGSLPFTCNYDKADFARLKKLEHKQEKYGLWFGGEEDASGNVQPTGSDGKFEFTGELSVYLKGTSVSSAVDMGVSITPSTEIKLVEESA